MRPFGQRSYSSPLLPLLALCAINVAADEDRKKSQTPKPTVTTAPIYLPYYDQRSWSLVRGSVISTDPSASRTTYTIFCPTQTPPACDLSLEFPFVLVEGPDTVQFHGTYTSTIADVECDLDGTTAATCSGYSSYKSGYTNGHHTGPTEVSWTSTFTGTDMQWGTLTLTDKPDSTDDSLDPTGTAMATPTGPSGMMYEPTPTSAADSTLRNSKPWTVAALLSSFAATYLML
ncbi:hypothetical protein PT974_00768 [Cladobotryum mycophilum]|uniref:Uncharacterized protein n=1 Tax=Cladobotryum mycophilum TaxID=491253 RepID=A0ABR0T2C8_9HYPO